MRQSQRLYGYKPDKPHRKELIPMSTKQEQARKGAETRRLNAEARKRKVMKELSEDMLIREAMLSVLADPNASSAQKLEAARYIKGGGNYGK